MAMSDLQGLVDALAADLGRPVGVDDRQYRALAYSSHVDGVDPVRLASILQREAPRKVIAWLESLGIRDAEDPVRLPAHRGFGMAARVCVPIRFDGTLLGYVWLIDEPEPLGEAELAESQRYAADLGVALYRVRRLEHEDRDRERDLLERLVGRRAATAPADVAEELLRDGFLATAAAYAVIVVQAFQAGGERAPDEVRVRLAAAAEHVRRGVAPRHLLVLVAGEQVVGVLSCADAGELERRGRALAAAVERNLADRPGWTALVAAGGERASASELPASHAEAQRALRVGHAVGEPAPLVQWSALGAYRTLSALLGDADPSRLLPASTMRLLASPEAATLVPTLERYLDLGGDARAAAAALFVHRSSLYGRLRRIEQVAGVDLHFGEDRLELHLGLRLWRLDGGRLPTT
jgi:DNA-binding PucR family transcriptional regulator